MFLIVGVKMRSKKPIKAFILEHVTKHPADIVSYTAEKRGVSRTAVINHINQLIKANQLQKTGRTKQTRYYRSDAVCKTMRFSLKKPLDEMLIFSEQIAPSLKKLVNKNAFGISEYATTELLNNAKDHSRGRFVEITFDVQFNTLKIEVLDDGIGVFENLNTVLGYDDLRDTILQLTKGKFTTDANNHSGEGLFFTSRSVDLFCIEANGLSFVCDNVSQDWTIHASGINTGSKISLEISVDSTTDLVEVFKKYQDEDSLEFSKTDMKVKLLDVMGARLISRSQAKRLVQGFERFSTITLDFLGVEAVGQGFVDEIFRVYQRAHPDIVFHYINANENVGYMIQRGLPK